MAKNKKEQNESPVIIDYITDIISSVIKPIQNRILNQIEESVARTINRILSFLFLIVLSIVALIFVLLGFVFWISSVTGFGLWFGFLTVGLALFFSIAIFGMFNRLSAK